MHHILVFLFAEPSGRHMLAIQVLKHGTHPEEAVVFYVLHVFHVINNNSCNWMET